MSHLTEPLQIGRCALKHRIVLAPLTRLRANDEHVPPDMMLEYYSQRACVPGTLLIAEATFIDERARGRDQNVPGIYTSQQIEGWKRIADEVHKKGCYIFIQIWCLGRAARKEALEELGLEMVSSGNIPLDKQSPAPRPMTSEEIWECIRWFAQAAKNAIAAGADGVEIHAANGYLIDQFTQDTCNNRTDEWGGSVENRSRFCLEVVKAVSEAIGPDRTAVRLSPFSTFQGMGMKETIPQFTHLISHLRGLGLAYLHLIEPRIFGNRDREDWEAQEKGSLDFAIEAWGEVGPIILAGGYSASKANQALETYLKDQPAAFAFGRYFISNPDLAYRLSHNIPLAPYNRDTFYTAKSPRGYIDYDFSEAWKKAAAQA